MSYYDKFIKPESLSDHQVYVVCLLARLTGLRHSECVKQIRENPAIAQDTSVFVNFLTEIKGKDL